MTEAKANAAMPAGAWCSKSCIAPLCSCISGPHPSSCSWHRHHPWPCACTCTCPLPSAQSTHPSHSSMSTTPLLGVRATPKNALQRFGEQTSITHSQQPHSTNALQVHCTTQPWLEASHLKAWLATSATFAPTVHCACSQPKSMQQHSHYIGVPQLVQAHCLLQAQQSMHGRQAKHACMPGSKVSVGGDGPESGPRGHRPGMYHRLECFGGQARRRHEPGGG